MEKLKKFYKENRIFVILMGVVLICLIICVILLFRYFYFGEGKNPGQVCQAVTEGKSNDFVSNLEKDDTVSDAKIRISEKSDIIFITIKFEADTSLVEAQTKAVSSLEILDETTRECYDFQFMISKPKSETSDAFSLMGSLNVSGTNISWNNNTKVESSEDD